MIIDFRLVSKNRYPATLSKLYRVIIGRVRHLSHVHCIMVRVVNHSICSVYLNLKKWTNKYIGFRKEQTRK